MAKAYSADLRERVIAAVEGGLSRRAAAARFALSPSAAIKWVDRWQETGSKQAKPMGGGRSPMEDHASLLLSLLAEQPDLTLDELHALVRTHGVSTSRSALWRFFDRHGISFKKNPARR